VVVVVVVGGGGWGWGGGGKFTKLVFADYAQWHFKKEKVQTI
jgi:hypothetical protein